MKKFLSLLFLLFTTLSLIISCSSEDSDSTNSPVLPENLDEPLVCVFYGINGLGDLTYNDSINSGVTKAEKEYKLLQINYSPESWDAAPSYLDYIFTEIKKRSLTSNRVLCIFADNNYLSLLEKNTLFMDNLPVTAIMFDTQESEIPAPLKDKLHSVYIPYYGASYAAGKYAEKFVAEQKKIFESYEKVPFIILPDKQNMLLFEYSRSFLKGMGIQPPESVEAIKSAIDDAENPVSTLSYFYLFLSDSSKKTSGFDMADELYKIARLYNPFDLFSILFPLCGGSSLGLIHYANEKSEILTFSIIGIDIDMSLLCPIDVPFSVVKHSDTIACELIGQWLNSKLPKSQTKTFADGYTGITVSRLYSKLQEYSDYFPEKFCNDVKEEAAEYENEILGKLQ